LYAQENARFECRLLKGKFPGVAVTVESYWKELPSQLTFVPWVASEGSACMQIQLTPKKRGYLTLENCHYSTRFPFGLFQKSHNERLDERWIVYPSISRLPDDFFKWQGRDPSPQLSNRQGVGTLPFVLRDYRQGDGLRQIHWKMSAKRQRLIVKEMEEESSLGDFFCLDAWPLAMSADEMENFISFMASLIFSVYERERPMGLVTPERRFEPEHSRRQLHRILEFLALVKPSKNNGKRRAAPPVEWNQRIIDVLSLWTAHGKTYVRHA
jgi:uncharacterized protein (DUF58 family)